MAQYLTLNVILPNNKSTTEIKSLPNNLNIIPFKSIDLRGLVPIPTPKRISRYTLPIFIEKAISVHGNIYDYSLIKEEDVKNAYSYVNIRCKECMYVWICNIHNHISRKSGCPNCSGKLRWTLARFLETTLQMYGYKYDYSKVTAEHIKGVDSKVPVICRECSYEFTPSIDNHINHKTECPFCAGNLRWTHARLINKAHEIHGYRYNYDDISDKDILSTSSVLQLYCNTCHNKWLCSIHNHIYNKSGCPYCNMSVGESAILNILNQWGYTTEITSDNSTSF
jgi:predicted Zn-ribbon and HTH transcriptional regulator